MSAKGSEAARTDGGSGVFNYSIARPKLYEETRCKCVWDRGWMGWNGTQPVSLSLSSSSSLARSFPYFSRALDPMRLNFGGGKVLRGEVTRPEGHYERTKRG